MINTFAPKGRIYGPIMSKKLLCRKDLSLGAKALYAVLCSCSGERDYCWPSQAYLADAMGVTVRSVQNYLGELVELQFISVDRRIGGTAKYYFLAHTDLQNDSSNMNEAKKPTYEKFSEGDENFSPILNLNIIKDKIPPLPPKVETASPTPPSASRSSRRGGDSFSNSQSEKQLEAEFEKLWTAWPRNEDKAGALRKWKMLKRKRELPETNCLLAKVHELAERDYCWKRGKAPYLRNWLFNYGWLQEPVQDTSITPTTGTNGTDLTLINKLNEEFELREKRRTADLMKQHNFLMQLPDSDPRKIHLLRFKIPQIEGCSYADRN